MSNATYRVEISLRKPDKPDKKIQVKSVFVSGESLYIVKSYAKEKIRLSNIRNDDKILILDEVTYVSG